MEEHCTGVLIAIDWENIRRGALMYQAEITPQDVAQAMTAVGRIFGEVPGREGLRRLESPARGRPGVHRGRHRAIPRAPHHGGQG